LAKELEMPRGASTVQLCWLMDKAGEEGQDRVSLCKRGTSSRQKAPRGLIRNPEGGATPSLTLYHLVLLCCSNIYLYLNTRAAYPFERYAQWWICGGSPPVGHSVRRSTSRSPEATQLKWLQILWRVG
jgi:hypothetical protein